MLGIWNSEERGALKPLLYFASLIAFLSLASCKKYTAASTAVTCTTTTSTTSTSTSISTCTDPVTNISVSIAPATISVNVVTTQQFLDSIQGGTNSVTIWKVNNTTGGDDTVGRIDSNGLYHAPQVVPMPNTVSVTAVSFEDQKVFATSTVTIVPAPVVTINSPSCTNTSTSPTIPACVTAATSGAANNVTFTASETGGTTTTVLWYVGPAGGLGILGGNATLGTINASGVYSPPLTPPIGKIVTVSAAAQDAPTSIASLFVTISNYSPSSLQGQFAFSISGRRASVPFFTAGSFTADGLGNLSAGLEDFNDASGPTAVPISFSGTYTVTADGRGTLTFNDGKGPAPTNSSHFHFVLANNNRVEIVGSDSDGTSAGEADLTDPSKFSLGLSGIYVFDFAGVHGSNALSQIGEFTAKSAGNVTVGSIDINDGGAISPQIPITSGTYILNSSTGRGTLNFVASGTTFNFAFYMVSQGSAKIVGTDTGQKVSGVISQQSPNVTFDPTTLNGKYAFRLGGSGSGGTYASAGSFSANGLSAITGGVLDEHLNGAPPNQNVMLSGGNYTVSSTGRGTATFGGGRAYVFYLGTTGNAFFQETDAGHPVSDGVFALQQNPSFSTSQISGNFSVSTAGLSGATPEVSAGDFATGGTGAISSGILDNNTGGTTSTGIPIAATSAFSTSSSAERGTLILNLGNPVTGTRTFAVYVVDTTDVFVVEIDSNFAIGELLKQY
jgi:hypothetical protein